MNDYLSRIAHHEQAYAWQRMTESTIGVDRRVVMEAWRRALIVEALAASRALSCVGCKEGRTHVHPEGRVAELKDSIGE